MLRVLSLLLPALIPSWRFFRSVEPSPRVEWRDMGQGTDDWHAYRPRPQSLRWHDHARRLFWNPHWNETLFMVSLAERQTIAPSPDTLEAIWTRLRRDVPTGRIQFRLVFVSREAGQITAEVTYLSDARDPRA